MKLEVIGHNMTEVTKGNGVTVFFSYNTPVAVYVSGKGYYRTGHKFSRTTSRHIDKWLGGIDATEVSQAEIERMANE